MCEENLVMWSEFYFVKFKSGTMFSEDPYKNRDILEFKKRTIKIFR